MDNISKLFQLQASDKNAVVAEDLSLTEIQEKLYIKTELDNYLFNSCMDAKNNKRPSLYIISGNAGDGKSMLLKRTKIELTDKLQETEIEFNYDATQVNTKLEDLTNKLFAFFDNFINDYKNNNFKVYIIAMNIGIAIRFFNDLNYEQLVLNSGNQELHLILKKIIFNELNIKRIDPSENHRDNNFITNLEVINYDNRVLVRPHLSEPNIFDQSFFSKMIDQLKEVFDFDECNNCCAKKNCPVYYNMKSLTENKIIISKIENILFKVFLYKSVHLTPRNLWDFLFNIIVGGTNKYLDLKMDSEDSPCEIFRKLPSHKFKNFTFYNNLYDTQTDNLIIKFIAENSSKFDPFYLNNKYLELTKIFFLANPQKYMDNLKSEILNGENYTGLDINQIDLHVLSDDLNNTDMLEKIVRLIYFHNQNEERNNDILYSDSSQVFNKENFDNFFTSLFSQFKNHVYGESARIDRNLAKNVRAAITNIFGEKMNNNTYFQLDTVSTRGKGRLYSNLDLEIPLDVVPNNYLLNNNHLKIIDYFPNSLLININGSVLEIDYELYTIIILSSKGYNISSLDLDKFYNLKDKSKSFFKNPKNDEVLYEYENKFLKVFYNSMDYEDQVKDYE